MAVPDERLRGAIELAFVVAVLGSRQRPPLAVPAAIKPYLRFQKLPAAALGPVRRAVEGDDDFRQRVALAANEDLAGPAGLLWLQRPEGWEAQIVELSTVQELAEQAEDAERQERTASRRLEAAELAARSASAELAGVRAQLAAETTRRDELTRQFERLDRRATQLEVELGGARRRLAEAEERLGAASVGAQAVIDEAVARAANDLRSAHQAELAARDAAVARADAALVLRAAAVARAEEALSDPVPLPIGREPVVATDDGSGRLVAADLTRLASALGDAAKAAEALGRALGDAGEVFSRLQPDPIGPVAVSRPDPESRRRTGVADRVSPSRVHRARRVAQTLPRGMMAESVEAALHLLRVPGILVVVDGYNVAMLGWPDLALAEQRSRLLDRLDEVVARHGTLVQVVFDGADSASERVPARRRLVRVAFSPAGVVADDVIVELVGRQPVAQAVVVATNDNGLRARVRPHGVNLVASDQLLQAAGRIV